MQYKSKSSPSPAAQYTVHNAQFTQFALQCKGGTAPGLGTHRYVVIFVEIHPQGKVQKLNPVKRSAANILSELFILGPRYVHCALRQIWTDRASVLANGKSGRILSTTFLSHPLFSSPGMSRHPLLLGTQVVPHNRPQSKHNPLC